MPSKAESSGVGVCIANARQVAVQSSPHSCYFSLPKSPMEQARRTSLLHGEVEWEMQQAATDIATAKTFNAEYCVGKGVPDA